MALSLPRTSSAKSVGELAQLVDRGFDATVNLVNPALKSLAAVTATQVWTAASPLHGWVNFGSGFDALSYRKDAMGVVWWSGLVKSGTVGFAAANAIVIPPPGFRTKRKPIFTADTNGVFGEIRVNNYGGFEIVCTIGNNGYVSLAQVFYLADS